MFTMQFWQDTIERAIRTFAQFLLASGVLDPLSTDLQTALGTKLIGAGVAAIVTILTCLAATGFGNRRTASFRESGHGNQDTWFTVMFVVLAVLLILVLTRQL